MIEKGSVILETSQQKSSKGITGSALKWIAILAMLTDHIGATVMLAFLRDIAGQQELFAQWYSVYMMMRRIGRIAFPIFCFLLTEGIRYTSNARKYGIRLFCFAIISEVPFNYAIRGTMIEPGYLHNVFFTLLMGFLAVEAVLYIQKRQIMPASLSLVSVISAVFCMIVAEMMEMDYGAVGVLTIVLMYVLPEYVFPGKRIFSLFLSCIPLACSGGIEIVALCAIAFLALYHGQRGRQMKYFFYLFYPLHLLILGIVTHMIW